jgi:hypothetical protein
MMCVRLRPPVTVPVNRNLTLLRAPVSLIDIAQSNATFCQ